jgi:hypothetical protein
MLHRKNIATHSQERFGLNMIILYLLYVIKTLKAEVNLNYI